MALESNKCAKCGFANVSGAGFCRHCGCAMTVTCPKCGNEIGSNMCFCRYCGTALASHTTPLEQARSTTTGQSENSLHDKNIFSETDQQVIRKKVNYKNNDKLKGMLVSPDENIRAILGQNYLESMLAGEGVNKNVMILTDKRLYIKGKRFVSKGTSQAIGLGSATNYIIGDLILSLDNITGVEIAMASRYLAKAASFIFAIGTLLSVMAIKGTTGYYKIGAISAFFACALLLVASLWSVRLGGRILLVNHIGGPSWVSSRWYSEMELQKFRQELCLAIERNSNKGK